MVPYTCPADRQAVTLGRNAEAGDYLRGKPYVSRMHAELTCENGSLLVRNLSRTNPTFVNGERLGDEPRPLKDGDLLMLGGTLIDGSMQENAAYFRIRRR